MLAIPRAINPVPSSNMNPQFCHAFAHWLCVAEVARFNLSQSSCNPGFRYLIPKRGDPLDEWRTPVSITVIDDLDH
jgi:hypothetical protein